MKKKFSLIELIAGMVILTIVVTAVATYIGNTLSNLKTPELLLAHGVNLRSICSKMRGDFKINYQGNLTGFRTQIGLSGNQNNSYGQYQVLENQFVTYTNNGSGLYIENSGGTATDFLKIRIKALSGSNEQLLIFRGNP